MAKSVTFTFHLPQVTVTPHSVYPFNALTLTDNKTNFSSCHATSGMLGFALQTFISAAPPHTMIFPEDLKHNLSFNTRHSRQ
jgi:hypothetical protein